MIKISNLSYYYQMPHKERIVVLRDVNLSIEKGEFVAVLGPNGCGKTTLSKHLNALLIPREGTVLIDGLLTKDISNLWKIRQKVGYVFQNPENQIVASLVEEDVAFGPENLGLDPSEIKERVQKSLEFVGMQEFARWEPHFLSAGQQQRVAIASVLAMEPEVMVLDEPTSMLDYAGRKEVLDIICKLNKEESVTVIFITSFVEEAIRADRAVIMQNGKIFEQGYPKEILSNPTELRELGINPLPINELAVSLSRSGLDISPSVLTIQEMVKGLCSLS